MTTKRVRICVAIDEDGEYGAGTAGAGFSAKGQAAEDLNSNSGDLSRCHYVYIEADVPLPEIVTVQGEVKR